jgi:hypothetical protein
MPNTEEIEAIIRGVQEEQKALVWQTYREYGPADLEALIRYAGTGIQVASENLEEALEAEDHQAACEAARALGQHQIRLTVAEMQMRWRAQKLEEPPEWGGDYQISPLVEREMTDGEVDKVTERLNIRADLQDHLNGESWDELNRGERSDIYDDLDARYRKDRSSIRDLVKDLTRE